MEQVAFLLHDSTLLNLRGLIGLPLRQIDFQGIIPSGTVGALPLTFWAGDLGVSIGVESDEFPISPFDFCPVISFVEIRSDSEPSQSSGRILHLQDQRLLDIEIVRWSVKGFHAGGQFLDMVLDLGFVLRTNSGFISLQRTFAGDFAVDIQLGTHGDVVTIVSPADFCGAEDEGYRYDVKYEVISLSEKFPTIN